MAGLQKINNLLHNSTVMRKFLIGIIILFVLILGLVFLARFLFSPTSPTDTPSSNENLEEFADKTTQVSFTADGAIVALENHRSIKITVNESARKLEVIKGYQGETIAIREFDNTPEAFERFLIGLNSFGYTMQDTEVPKDERGACPSGISYIYQATYTSGDPLKSWSSTCGDGRLKGKGGDIRRLFQDQIINYDELVADVNLIP